MFVCVYRETKVVLAVLVPPESPAVLDHLDHPDLLDKMDQQDEL